MRERRVLEALLGVYVATVSVPAGALAWRSREVTAGLPPVGVLVGSGVLVAVVVALVARRVDDLADRLSSLPVVTATVLPPLAYLPYMVLVLSPASTPTLVAAVGLLAVVPGIAVPVGGAVVRNRRIRADATELTVVTVGDEDGDGDGGDDRNWPAIAGAVVAGVGFIVFGALTAFTGAVEGGAGFTALSGLSSTLFLLGDDDSTELGVTDAGLRIDRAFVDWDDLEGYRLTDDSLALVRSQWYLPTRDFDRDEIDDEDALVEALGRFLPRLDDDGRVVATARP